jgi:ribosomal protein S12 methylthiotransferase accessory factor
MSGPIMEVGFPGGLVVESTFKGHTVRTDQPVKAGGTNSAPAPFDLFLASIATCVGFYAVSFCRRREIDISGLAVTLEPVSDSATHRTTDLRIELRLPREFPEKYRRAIVRAVDQCAVKRHVLEPPRFEVAIAPSAGV